MKISLFGHYSIYTNWVLNLLIRELKNVQIQRAYFSGCESYNGVLTAKKIFRNSSTEGYVTLKTIEQSLWLDHLFPLIDNSTSPDGFLSYDALSQVHNIEFIVANSPNSKQILELMYEDDADLFLSIRYAGLFREKALAIPKIGTLNLHSSILPYYKGLENTMQAILNEEKLIGCSLHWIHDPYPEIDTGPVIDHSEVDVDFNKSLFWNCFQLYPAGVELIVNAILKIKKSHLDSNLPCQSESGEYFSVPKNEDYERLQRMGMPVFDLKEISQLVQKYYTPDFQHETLMNIIEKYYPDLVNAIAYEN